MGADLIQPLTVTAGVVAPCFSVPDGGGGPGDQRPDADYPGVAVSAGRPQSGRHREHVFPARRHRVAPSFTAEEYAAVVTAATRAGLTPTGFCARAALRHAGEGGAIAGRDAAGPASSNAAASLGPGRVDGARVEALAAVQAELADMRIAVVRVGTNLNQAVAAFHSTGQEPVWLARVVELCGRALASVDEAASRLHRRLP